MVKPIPPIQPRASDNLDESGDSEDLQALFDSIAASGNDEPPPPVSSPAASGPDPSGDSSELQALFDSVVAEVGEPALAASQPTDSTDARSDQVNEEMGAPQVFNRIGHMTRELHNTMRELGYDKMLEDTAKSIPDAHQRLSYIVQMTEQAASRVLNATEIAMPIQEALQGQAGVLEQRWEKVFSNQLSPEEFKSLAVDTHTFLRGIPQQVSVTNAQLMEIMMAQDFQDLTGQVIKKVVELAQRMEQQLLSVLLETMPAEVRVEAPEGLLNGPVINAEGRTDVVTNQTQVDDLLESLGF